MKRFLVCLLCCTMLVGCGASSEDHAGNGGAGFMIDTTANGSGFDIGLSSSSSSDSATKSSVNSFSDTSYNESVDIESDNSSTSLESSSDDNELLEEESSGFNKDMLVYTGNISLTTKDYESTKANLKELLSNYDCFVQYSRESTSATGEFVDGVRELLHVYDLKVRVKSSQFESLMESASDKTLGVVTDKSSNAENVNVEYSDVTTALKIYRAREKRLLNMLEEAETDEAALRIENELTRLTLDIAQYESRKNVLETDVAYSYVTLSIKEVKEYTAQVKHDDSFWTRLKKEAVNTWYATIASMEEFVLGSVRAIPTIIKFAVILLLCKVFKVFTRLKNLIKKIKKDETEDTVETKQE